MDDEDYLLGFILVLTGGIVYLSIIETSFSPIQQMVIFIAKAIFIGSVARIFLRHTGVTS